MNMDIVEAIVEDLIEKVTMNPSRAAPANERAGLDTMLVDIGWIFEFCFIDFSSKALVSHGSF